jgi:CRISPR-associated endonuclease/helicase Cas3
MVPDLKILKSHPDKPLLQHVQGVKENTKKLTNSRYAELVAIFHDLGKINPHFQDKLDPQKKVSGYANHAYLSAYIFFCAFCCSKTNLDVLKQFLNVEFLTLNELIALAIVIAKHHGNLPDFTPYDYSGAGASILSKEENFALFKFIESGIRLPYFEYINHFIPIEDFNRHIKDKKVQENYSDKLIFRGDKNLSALDFFTDYQFVFASVLQADKAEAGDINYVIDEQKIAVKAFSSCFSQQLKTYLKKLNQNTELNKLRTTIREHAVNNIRDGLKDNKQVFELTAPTGSGKTLMMLSLASEIIETKGAKRIIYSLPFLSITEQVETEVLKIFEGKEEYIQRIDSKSENYRFEKVQKELDSNPTKEKIDEIKVLEFLDNTFAYPFIITTFVRFFETLLSNRNSELLKLPNFSNSIFLLDEIQALPSRLYGFLIGYLSRFCEKFGSYAIISTATQPNYELPNDNRDAQEFFKNYKKPHPLLSLNFFDNDLFNRYKVDFSKEPIDLESLRESIMLENKSVLVILNTIDDTKELYKLLIDEFSKEEILLLNTHFTPHHRKLKIYLAKRRLRQNKRVIVISTQLIEAGVDIDFPIVYRDFATVASIIQSAGRCNRNGKLDSKGQVKLFILQRNGQHRSELIYRGRDKELLRLTRNSFKALQYEEKELLNVQRDFFNQIQTDLDWGKHSQSNPKLDFDFMKDIQECQFEKLGQFQLIDNHTFGNVYPYYVRKDDSDTEYETLKEIILLSMGAKDYEESRRYKIQINQHLKKMSNRIINVRVIYEASAPGYINRDKQYSDIRVLADLDEYSFDEGLKVKGYSIL